MITREVSIVFHVAATVRFDEKMKLAVPINVRSPKEMIDLCKEISYLKVSHQIYICIQINIYVYNLLIINYYYNYNYIVKQI